MSLHPRTRTVTTAHNEAAQALLVIWDKYELTWGEIVRFHGKQIDDAGRYIVRTERHPDDPEKKGDEA